jgi:hypothetical protein
LFSPRWGAHAALGVNPERTRQWSEVIKNYLQIAAIVVGAWWTYNLFVKKDAPGLEARGNVISDLTWSPPASPDYSEVVFAVLLENKGTTSFDISKIRLRAWEFDFGNPTKRFVFFDSAKMLTETFFDEEYKLTPQSSLPFPSHYPPGAAMNNSFAWLIKKPDCSKRLYFVAEFFQKGTEDTPTWFTYSWGRACPPDNTIPKPPE